MLDDAETAAEHSFRHEAETGARPDGVFFFIQTQEERIAQFPEGLGGILSVIFYVIIPSKGEASSNRIAWVASLPAQRGEPGIQGI